MNKQHLEFCGGAEWAETVQKHTIPWVTADVDLGDRLLEIGPGPGLTTNVLRTMVAAMTAVELDEELSTALAARMAGSNVTVVNADATRLPFEDGSFSASICLTMLHHVPDVAAQDRLLSEMARVLRPGGVMLGSDSLASDELRAFHEGDTYVPVPPDTLAARLAAIGLKDIVVDQNPFALRFRAVAV